MLTIFGSINIDQVIRVPSIPSPGETTLGERVMDAHGGKGANQAVAAARVRGGSVPVTMIGALGDDAHGRAALQNLAENGVVAGCASLPDCATGTAFITLSSDGENAITVIPGANAYLERSHVSAQILQDTSVLLCQGEVSLTETRHVMSAHRSCRPVGLNILNLAPVPQDRDVEGLRELLSICDILIVNEPEADAICGALGLANDGDLTVLAKAFACHVVITRGPDGAELLSPSGDRSHAPSPTIEPVDTTGAGDTFCGVFAMLLAEGWEINPAMQSACEAAAIACGVVGAQTGMPHRDDILERA